MVDLLNTSLKTGSNITGSTLHFVMKVSITILINTFNNYIILEMTFLKV